MSSAVDTQKLVMHIISQENNLLLPRKELHCEVIAKQTPSKESLTNELSNTLGIQKDLIVIESCKTGFGSDKTTFFCKVYKERATMEKIEPFHVISKIYKVASTKMSKKARKAQRKKKSKIWGTERRNTLKAERKEARGN
ncbi:30S ribosomal protein S24e [Cucumispora dikerogammari]|nr:30S ribosomal protein S24e [Cucumispora dikerogammari]